MQSAPAKRKLSTQEIEKLNAKYKALSIEKTGAGTLQRF